LTSLVIFGSLLYSFFTAALTVDEIIKLKRAGVAAPTIELLTKKSTERERITGIVRHDGWMIHTAEPREAERARVDD
jgi:hypothetical protein